MTVYQFLQKVYLDYSNLDMTQYPTCMIFQQFYNVVTKQTLVCFANKLSFLVNTDETL